MSKSKPIRALEFKTQKQKGRWAYPQAPTHKIFYGSRYR